MSRIGNKVSLPASSHSTSSAEIAGRDSQTKQNPPTSFGQIGPSDNPGMNAASKNMTKKSSTGAMKFSRFSGG